MSNPLYGVDCVVYPLEQFSFLGFLKKLARI